MAQRILTKICIIIVFVVFSLSKIYGEGNIERTNPQGYIKPPTITFHYDCQVTSGPDKGKYHSKELCQVGGNGFVYDPSDLSSGQECFFMNAICYKPASGNLYDNPWTGWGETLNTYEDIVNIRFDKGHFPLEFVKHLCLNINDTVILETQTNSIGEYSAVILAERDGVWVEVESDSIETKTFDEGSFIILTYQIKDVDTRLKTVSSFHIDSDRNNKPADDSFISIIDIGEPRQYLTHASLYIIVGSIIATVIILVLAVVIRKEQKKVV